MKIVEAPNQQNTERAYYYHLTDSEYAELVYARAQHSILRDKIDKDYAKLRGIEAQIVRLGTRPDHKDQS